MSADSDAPVATDTPTVTVSLTPAKDALPTEVQAVVDRAVRAARGKGWCTEFSQIAGKVFGLPDNEVVDSDGFNCKGYNAAGFNTEGWDREGYNTEGRDQAGFDKAGFDMEGFGKDGMNAEGFDRQGRDKYRYDANGYDVEGYSANGYRREASREWYTRQAAKPESEFIYDRNYNTRPAKGVKAAASKVRSKLGMGGGY